MSVGACRAGRSRALLRPTCSGISLSLPKAVRREAALWVVFLGGHIRQPGLDVRSYDRGILERGIAKDGGDTEQLDPGVMSGQENGERVL